MSDKQIDTRIALLEQKFDNLIQVITEMKWIVERLSVNFVEDHRKEMSEMKTSIELLKQETWQHAKKIGWMSGVIWSFAWIVWLAVLSAVLNSVLK